MKSEPNHTDALSVSELHLSLTACPTHLASIHSMSTLGGHLLYLTDIVIRLFGELSYQYANEQSTFSTDERRGKQSTP